jgi:tetratricopeptide (TPR) repeat protein
MVRQVLLTLAIALTLTASLSARQAPRSSQAPSQTPSQAPNAQTDEGLPQLDSPTEPPRSEPRGPNDSSSRDRNVDISPPADDNEHEGSDLLGPEPAPGVVEMKPWNPHRADKDVEVGLYYFKQKNYSAAESRFREALQWQENHAEATYRLATVLEKTGKAAEAKQYYQQYLKILPNGEFARDSKKALDRLSGEGSAKVVNRVPTSQP